MTTPQQLLANAAAELLDPQGRALAGAVEWWALPGLPEQWPVAVIGTGPPVLLLHGFDSSMLEFRRLVPLLASDHQLILPDLYGFGFTPRPADGAYNPAGVLSHLESLITALLARWSADNPPQAASPTLGVIGASMGGSVAMELARRLPERISRLLLLAPAGLTGRPMPVPPLLDSLGVRFLSLPWVRRGLCRSAFADPANGMGAAELEIASLHLQAPGWAMALGQFARSGGFAGCGHPLPLQPIDVLWGTQDRILRPAQKSAALALLGDRVVELDHCGHLPHIDQPQLVAAQWRQFSPRSAPKT
jgi:pimeloyl-ACP methyl ester carboxylesterase